MADEADLAAIAADLAEIAVAVAVAAAAAMAAAGAIASHAGNNWSPFVTQVFLTPDKRRDCTDVARTMDAGLPPVNRAGRSLRLWAASNNSKKETNEFFRTGINESAIERV